MRLRYLYLSLLFTFFAAESTLASDRIRLSNIKFLKLDKKKFTNFRRTKAYPQLQLVGGSAKGLYEVEVMVCTNMGSDYNGNMSWECNAKVPKYFKLGSTDVVCEDYGDDFVLKDSCMVEYTLSLTDAGFEKYGTGMPFSNRVVHSFDKWWSYIFTIIFWSVVAFILFGVYQAFTSQHTVNPRRRGGNGPRFDNRRPWYGGGGDNDDDPPPPYDYFPPRFTKKTSFPGQTSTWRPGFWSGIAAGAASSYLMGAARNRAGGNTYRAPSPSRSFFGNGGGGSSFAESSSAGASTHETTGFGRTRRR